MKTASKELMDALYTIAEGLRGAAIKKDKFGRDFVHVEIQAAWGDNWGDEEVRDISPDVVHELGNLLLQIRFDRADARKLFRQNERRKPRKDLTHQIVAAVYWSVRALNPLASDGCAIREARSKIAGSSSLSDATIRKIAQKWRENIIGQYGLILQSRSQSRGLINGRPDEYFIYENERIYMRTDEQISALRDYLRKKQARPNVDT